MNNKKRLSYWDIEKLGKKELSDMELGKQDTEKLSYIEKSDKELLKEFPPEIMIGKIEKKYKEYTDSRFSGKAARFLSKFKQPTLNRYSLAGITAVLLLLIINYNLSNGPDIILKGEPNLAIFKKLSETDALKLENNSTVEVGDIIQIQYNASGYKYGIIFSIDGNGKITLHSPTDRNDYAFEAVDNSFLPNAFELDNAPNHEKFYMVLSDIKFRVCDILDKIDKSGNITFTGNNFYVTTFTLIKKGDL
ncbi:MAG: hypothetical protein JXA66_07575 [Oligoflexia bacterium]|nr:hypothetical protein [Oligoflexia bacterium]